MTGAIVEAFHSPAISRASLMLTVVPDPLDKWDTGLRLLPACLFWKERASLLVETPTLMVRFVCNLTLSRASSREDYIEKVRSAAKKSRNPYLSVMWTEGGAQPALEKAMGLTFGYPAVIAISVEKKVRKTLPITLASSSFLCP